MSVDIVDRLRAFSEDPMGADHAEVSKTTLRRAAGEIEQLRIRLEIDPTHEYDGIGARDVTIKSLELEAARLRSEVASKQAEIDRLMLEFCPGEMTPQQMEEWGRHQRTYHMSEAEQRALNNALKRSVRFLDSEPPQTASGSPLNARSD